MMLVVARNMATWWMTHKVWIGASGWDVMRWLEMDMGR